MSSPYVTLGNRPLDQWKVTELKEELKRRKLTIKGLKEDLIKRLDEAVRSDWESAKKSDDNNLNEIDQSESPSEQETEGYTGSGRSKDLADTEGSLIGTPDPNPEIGIDHDRGLVSEGKDMEVNLGQEFNTVEVAEEHVSQLTIVETAVVVSEPAETLTGSVLHNYGQNKEVDLTRGVNHDGVESHHEDVTPELSDPSIQIPLIDESSTTMVPPGGVDLKGSEVQNEGTVSLDLPEMDTSEGPQPDHKVQQLKYQVSEVEHPHLGSQVITDTVSTESVSIIEKNELKLDVINDSVLELDVDCEIPPLPSTFTPDDGETHPMDVEEPPPLDTKVENEEVHDRNAETVDSPKNIDGDELGPEKLNLDRSSGDDSMEEDVLESKQMDYKSVSDQTRDLVEKSEVPIVEEDNIVDVVGGDKTVEAIVDNAENKKVAGLTSVKRKFDDDNEAVGNNDTAKRSHRWKVGGLKVSEQGGNSETLKTPKGSSQDSQTSIKRFNTADTTKNEAPKERLVPPSPKAPSNSLRIDRFVRPFTLKAVQELLGKTGTVTSFWMDHIKTHCYVSYSSIEEAVDTRNAVYNLQWPPNGGRTLVVEFVDPQEVKTRVEASPAISTTPSSSVPSTFSTAPPPVQPQPSPRQQVPTLQLPPLSLPLPPPLATAAPVRERQHPSRVPPLPREQLHLHPDRDQHNLPPPLLPEKIDPPIVTLDDLFRKTISTPRIYYLPLSDEQVAAKLNSQGKNV